MSVLPFFNHDDIDWSDLADLPSKELLDRLSKLPLWRTSPITGASTLLQPVVEYCIRRNEIWIIASLMAEAPPSILEEFLYVDSQHNVALIRHFCEFDGKSLHSALNNSAFLLRALAHLLEHCPQELLTELSDPARLRRHCTQQPGLLSALLAVLSSNFEDQVEPLFESPDTKKRTVAFLITLATAVSLDQTPGRIDFYRSAISLEPTLSSTIAKDLIFTLENLGWCLDWMQVDVLAVMGTDRFKETLLSQAPKRTLETAEAVASYWEAHQSLFKTGTQMFGLLSQTSRTLGACLIEQRSQDLLGDEVCPLIVRLAEPFADDIEWHIEFLNCISSKFSESLKLMPLDRFFNGALEKIIIPNGVTSIDWEFWLSNELWKPSNSDHSLVCIAKKFLLSPQSLSLEEFVDFPPELAEELLVVHFDRFVGVSSKQSERYYPEHARFQEWMAFLVSLLLPEELPVRPSITYGSFCWDVSTASSVVSYCLRPGTLERITGGPLSSDMRQNGAAYILNVLFGFCEVELPSDFSCKTSPTDLKDYVPELLRLNEDIPIDCQESSHMLVFFAALLRGLHSPETFDTTLLDLIQRDDYETQLSSSDVAMLCVLVSEAVLKSLAVSFSGSQLEACWSTLLRLERPQLAVELGLPSDEAISRSEAESRHRETKALRSEREQALTERTEFLASKEAEVRECQSKLDGSVWGLKVALVFFACSTLSGGFSLSGFGFQAPLVWAVLLLWTLAISVLGFRIVSFRSISSELSKLQDEVSSAKSRIHELKEELILLRRSEEQGKRVLDRYLRSFHRPYFFNSQGPLTRTESSLVQSAGGCCVMALFTLTVGSVWITCFVYLVASAIISLAPT